MTETYQPKPGVPCLITIRATPFNVGSPLPGPLFFGFRASDEDGDLRDVAVTAAELVRVEAAPVKLPTGFGARIRATVTCSCGDEGSGVPVTDVVLVNADVPATSWKAREGLPCGCRHFVPTEDNGPDTFADVQILDRGEDQ